jgi:hypothetical protein
MMDRRVRGLAFPDVMMAIQEGFQAALWTALPGIIVSFNPAEQTAVIQPAIKGQRTNPDGTKEWVTIPLLLDCPVYFPGGGGYHLTFPVTVGDECLVIFASRCIDYWWQNGCPADAGGLPIAQEQAELRMHDLSDGFAFVGVSSKPKVIPSISTTKTQLRNDAGTTYVELDAGGNATIVAAGNVNATASGAANVTATGDVTVTGANINLNGTLKINGAPYLAHHHSGVAAGGATTGGVV